ncbi:zinc/manganese transport system substrate-binding protein [Arthrobacter alpinus]|uniref:Zinc/manganese transport system substrate-binding protein n=1 Tax=Arthrobacter alpinus TaxID=656366 RepID=A0A1H5EKF6_9MICC|nr:zinc ABC transporter substrate-binding protein [Arthrobacter alpinus]SED91518.1 zinc/manganese transport system substrate-binding protein [Arthrobacter alpinus]
MFQSRRSVLLVGATLAASLTLAACGGAETTTPGSEGTVSVVATTNVYADIAKAVGGDYVSVHAIISDPAADPHGYEANAQDKLAVSKAQVGIENGGGYDDFFTQLAKGQLDSAEIVNVSDMSGLDTGEGFNEHVWYSLPTMSKLADDLAARFSTALPAQSGAFTAQATAFKTKLTLMMTRLHELKAGHEGAGAAVTEPVPLYLLAEAGLVNKTPEKFTSAIENGADVPATTVAEVLAIMASKDVSLLAYNTQTESPQTQQVKAAAEAAGVPVVDFSETLPANTSYLDWMLGNVANLEQGLNTVAGK